MTKGIPKWLPGTFVGAVFFVACGLVHADDVTDAINEGLQYYNSGEYTDAAGSLDYAAQLIRQKKGSDLTSLLPAPLAGWTAEEAVSQAAGAAMLGGGITAEREYHKGESRITIQFITDSPVMQSVMMMFVNPMFASSDGGKLERIGGQKAIVKYDASGKSGDIKIVVANRFLVTVEGREVPKDDLVAYVKAIDYKRMAAMP